MDRSQFGLICIGTGMFIYILVLQDIAKNNWEGVSSFSSEDIEAYCATHDTNPNYGNCIDFVTGTLKSLFFFKVISLILVLVGLALFYDMYFLDIYFFNIYYQYKQKKEEKIAKRKHDEYVASPQYELDRKREEEKRMIAIRKRVDYVSSPQYKLDQKREEERRKIQREQDEWERTHTSGGDCPMCGNNMMVLIRPLPFKDECDKCNYTFTFVYKKINLGKDAWGDTEYGDGIKPTRPKPPKATVKSTGREPIPQDLMDVVWNRDGGQCVRCKSEQDLEYDHMIPLSKGGSNSYKNLQLLCRKCNRSKAAKIG
jgi:hypothetical protein